MKKLINVFIVMLFVLTLTVKADSGGPMFPTVSAEVKNNNVKCYDNYDLNGETVVTLNKGQVVNVRYVDGKRYEYTEKEYCYLNANDLIVGQRKYEMTTEDKLSEPKDLLIVDPNGAQMYSGPLAEYSKVDMVIPTGTTIKTHYQIGSMWYYVTYNEVSGYITSMKNAIVHKLSNESNTKVYPVDDMEIEGFDGKKVGTIPALTEIKDYWSTDDTREMYITYNGVSGFIPNFYTVATDCVGTKVKLLNEAPVYKTIARGENGKMQKISTASANKEYAVSYCFGGQGETGYYISALNGWLYFQYDDKIDYIETDKNGNVYDSREYREKHLLEKIEVDGYNLYFEKNVYSYNLEIDENTNKLSIVYLPSEDDNVKVDITGNDNLKNNSKITVKVRDDEGEHTYTINIIKKSSAVTPSVTPDEDEDSNKTIIWICLGACLLLVITTIVIIILVNKKKKSKVEVAPVVKNDEPAINRVEEREDTPKEEADNNGSED